MWATRAARPVVGSLASSSRQYAAAAARREPPEPIQIPSTVHQDIPPSPSPGPSPPSTSQKLRNAPRTARSRALDKAKRIAAALHDAQRSAPSAPVAGPSTGPLTDTPPSLSDLLLKRPKGSPDGLSRSKYVTQYTKSFAAIDRAFNKNQLIPLARDMGVHLTYRTVKADRIRQILRAWGWEDPKVLQEREREEVERAPAGQRDFDLTAAELFLVMRDRRLKVIAGKARDTSFAVVPGPTTTLGKTTLRVVGQEVVLDEIARFMQEHREAIRTLDIDADELGTVEPRPELFSSVSSACGVYIEQLPSGQYRLSGRIHPDIQRALALLHTATNELSRYSAQRALATATPATPQDLPGPRYTFSPHHYPPSSLIPWYEHATSRDKILRRLRRVEGWEAKPAKKEIELVNQEMDIATTRILRPATGKETAVPEQLRDVFASPTESQENTVTIRFGQVLFPSPASTALSTDHSEQLALEAVGHVIAKRLPRSFFVHGLTPAMIHFPLMTPPQKQRRLRYRHTNAEKTLRLTFAYTHPAPPQTTPEAPIAPVDVDSWQAQLDAMLAKHDEAEAGQEGVDESGSIADEPEVAAQIEGEPASVPPEPTGVHIDAQLEACEETDLLFPDRPVDARCTIRSATTRVVGAVDEGITKFFSDALGNQDNQARRANAVRPLTIRHGQPGQDEVPFELEADEEVEVTEVASSEEPGVILRTVRSRDMMLNIERWSVYTELECKGEPGPTFWKELAKVSRDVPPGASTRHHL